MAIPTKVSNRLVAGLKQFQPIVESAKTRDVNESDTVVLLTGIISDILGFDKYTDITTELSIRGTYCDLALRIDGKFKLLLEAKAIGLELKEAHIKQAVDYAANKGIEWVILSNGVNWKVFKVIFSKPINHILVLDINFLQLSHRSKDDLEILFLLTKEAIAKDSLEEFYSQKQATNKFILGNLLTQENIINSLKKELRTVYPDIKVGNDEILGVLIKDVIKRELLEGEESEEAKKKIAKALRKKERARTEKESLTQPAAETQENDVQTAAVSEG